MRSNLVPWSVAAFLAINACTSPNVAPADAAPDAWTYQRPPVPEGAILLESPEFEVAAGQEVLMCTYTPVVLAQNFDTREIHSYQASGGHHAIVFYTTVMQPPGPPHPCTDEEMSNLRLVGGGAESNEQGLVLPPGLAIRMPAGTQLVMQNHYVNITPRAVRVRDAMVIHRAAAAEIQHLADGFALNDGDMAIPPHSMYGRTLECTVDAQMNIVNMIGHTHQWSTRIRIERVPAGSSVPIEIYNEVGGQRLQFTPPQRRFPPETPLVFMPGDRVRLSCDWNNTTSDVLRYPQEMCSTFMYYYPARGFISCGRVIETRGGGDAGVPTGMGNAGCPAPRAAGEPCVRTCNTGNEVGVGRYCTRGGNQCGRNRSAILCTADFADDAPAGWCTKPCSSNEGCGSGAVCTGDSRGMGCTPVECVGGGGGDAGADAAAPGDASSDAPAAD